MEGERRRRIPSPPPNSDGDWNDDKAMSVSASDSSSVTGENREETLRFSENVILNDREPWTNEKHNMYLNHLEFSFVKKLHEAKYFLAPHSDSRSVSGECSRNDVSSYKKHISTSRNKLLSSVAAADFHIVIRSAAVYKSKYMTMHTTSMSKPLESVNHCQRTKHAQRVASLGSAAEGTGQNFVAEDWVYSSGTGRSRAAAESHAKNLELDSKCTPVES